MNTKQPKLNLNFRSQTGQSIVEYTVISSILVLALLVVDGDIIVKLNNAIKQNYDGYSYAVSLSEYPDKKKISDLIDMYDGQNMPQEQRDYLTDDTAELVEDLKNFSLTSFPGLSEGLDLLDNMGLGFSDFCDFCTGNPFDFL
ncbi:MAG: hypothetical protein A2W76_04760 [Gammaproteobacteria bacterium RIFCSPLOWO2_12_47_11]|nr:MAG: hypothetical protein A2W76_04760 [Gammaproteobacteria bacterium RIFCSPLOWO2_12_47_11]